MTTVDLTKTFSLLAFLDDLLAGLDGPELSWDLKINCLRDPETGKNSVLIRIPIRLYGKRREWVRDHVTAVAEKHGLEVDPIGWKDEDFSLRGAFGDILASRV